MKKKVNLNISSGVVIVTYNPDLYVIERQILSLKDATSIVFVDNGSDECVRQEMVNISKEYSQVALKFLGRNYGIAVAQNIGAELIDVDYVLFLDHDTVPKENSLQSMLLKAERLRKNVKLGAIGANLIDPRSDKVYGLHVLHKGLILKKYFLDSCNKSIECELLNSSGTLIPKSVLRAVGDMNESFFIDHVETEWCFRARYLGYKLYCDQQAVMEHQMGDDNCRYWFFGWRVMPYRAPLRHYYIFRNSIFLQKKAFVSTSWKFLNIFKLIFSLIYFSFFGREKKNHLMMMCLGILDGFRNRKDKFNA